MSFSAVQQRAPLFAVLFQVISLAAPSSVWAATEMSCPETPAPITLPGPSHGLRELGLPLGLRIGSAVTPAPGAYQEAAAREFSVLTPENAMKWEAVHPGQDVYKFCDADRIVRLARQNGMLVRGHTLAWDGQNPGWLVNAKVTRDQMIAILRDHIRAVVGHFKARFPGTVYQWDVVNEPINDCSVSPGDPLYRYYDRATEACTLRQNLWQRKIGDDYVALALQFAHESDPDALLYVNDYGTETDASWSLAKRRALMNLVTTLKATGVPIHGIGLQFHTGLEGPSPAALKTLMSDIASLGVDVAVTEMDVGLGVKSPAATASPPELERQAVAYRQVLGACLENLACRTFVVWGFTDASTWRWPDQPCILDRNFQPKPAYGALRERLLEGRKAGPQGEVRSYPR